MPVRRSVISLENLCLGSLPSLLINTARNHLHIIDVVHHVTIVGIEYG